MTIISALLPDSTSCEFRDMTGRVSARLRPGPLSYTLVHSTDFWLGDLAKLSLQKVEVLQMDPVTVAQHDDLSEDELASDHDDWQWIYEEGEVSCVETNSPSKKRKASEAFGQASERQIVGAQKGSLLLRLGDAVLLKAARNEQWVALVTEFLPDETEDGKEARFMWFTSPKEIRNKAKRRTDAMSVC